MIILFLIGMYNKLFKKIFFLLLVFLILFISFSPKISQAQRYGVNKRQSSAHYYTDIAMEGPLLRLGFGYGISYGYLGLNGEYKLFDYLSMTGGMGYTPGGPGWVMGARIYMNEPARRFRPRISALYGTVSVLSKKYGPEDQV